MLPFVARARSLGFSLEDVASLLDLWRDQHGASADVQSLARAHIATIDVKLAELEGMRRTLSERVERCHGESWA